MSHVPGTGGIVPPYLGGDPVPGGGAGRTLGVTPLDLLTERSMRTLVRNRENYDGLQGVTYSAMNEKRTRIAFQIQREALRG